MGLLSWRTAGAVAVTWGTLALSAWADPTVVRIRLPAVAEDAIPGMKFKELALEMDWDPKAKSFEPKAKWQAHFDRPDWNLVLNGTPGTREGDHVEGWVDITGETTQLNLIAVGPLGEVQKATGEFVADDWETALAEWNLEPRRFFLLSASLLYGVRTLTESVNNFQTSTGFGMQLPLVQAELSTFKGKRTLSEVWGLDAKAGIGITMPSAGVALPVQWLGGLDLERRNYWRIKKWGATLSPLAGVGARNFSQAAAIFTSGSSSASVGFTGRNTWLLWGEVGAVLRRPMTEERNLQLGLKLFRSISGTSTTAAADPAVEFVVGGWGGELTGSYDLGPNWSLSASFDYWVLSGTGAVYGWTSAIGVTRRF